MAEALASYYEDFWIPGNDLPPAVHQIYWGVVMRGLSPYFYKIPITPALAYAVRHLQFPVQETIIQRFRPPVPNMGEFLNQGMYPLENREICFQCFEALKAAL